MHILSLDLTNSGTDDLHETTKTLELDMENSGDSSDVSITIDDVEYGFLCTQYAANTTASGIAISFGKVFTEGQGYQKATHIVRTGGWIARTDRWIERTDLEPGFVSIIDSRAVIDRRTNAPFISDTPEKAKAIAAATLNSVSRDPYVHVVHADVSANPDDPMTITFRNERTWQEATFIADVARPLEMEGTASYEVGLTIGGIAYGYIRITVDSNKLVTVTMHPCRDHRGSRSATDTLTRQGAWIELHDKGFKPIVNGHPAFPHNRGITNPDWESLFYDTDSDARYVAYAHSVVYDGYEREVAPGFVDVRTDHR